MIHVIYHDDNDGIASALAAYIKFKDNAKYYSVNYGDDFPFFLNVLNKEDEIYILDFSYSKDKLELLKNKVSKLIVIDHHKTAQNELKDLDYCIFDISKSGCVLAHNYFHKGQEIHKLFKLVEDRDLWKFEYEDTEAFVLGITLHYKYKNIDFWYEIYNDDLLFNNIIEEGKIILKYKENQINNFIKSNKLKKVIWNNYNVAIYNATINISDLGSKILELNKNIDLTISYFFDKHGNIIFSFRTKDDRNIDVGEICKELGGGGHKNAAGVKMYFNDGLKFLSYFYNTNYD